MPDCIGVLSYRDEAPPPPTRRPLRTQNRYCLNGTLLQSGCYILLHHTVKPVLRDHCHERLPVLKDQIFLAEGPSFQCNELSLSPKTICLEKLHLMANGVVLQDRFYCNYYPMADSCNPVYKVYTIYNILTTQTHWESSLTMSKSLRNSSHWDSLVTTNKEILSDINITWSIC